jgi:hypothetical protein
LHKMEQQKTEAMMDLSDDASASSDLEESLPDLKNQAATETKNTLARRETKQGVYAQKERRTQLNRLSFAASNTPF